MYKGSRAGLGAGVLAAGLLATVSGYSASGPADSASAPAATLPGGATSLRETYEDWLVVCVAAPAGKACAMQQELKSQQTGQRVLAVELQPSASGATGTLVLPFGVALDNGATVQVDDGAPGARLRFRTCLPAGCIVPVNFDAQMLAQLRKGASMMIKAQPDGGGNEMQVPVSLKGFGAALDRTAALLR
jgi:invasion protein IalB